MRLPILLLTLALAACANSGVMVGGPAMQVGIPLRRTAAYGDSVSDRLYFGRNIAAPCDSTPAGMVSDSAWAAFLSEVVTPLFPAGLSVYRVEGQWQEKPDAPIVREESFVLEIVHRAEPDAEIAFRDIAARYKRRFCQQSVMRVTTPARQRFYD
ncbi:MAG: DUF3574 domain-containing protein [Longimicrobiaceae bacterium]